MDPPVTNRGNKTERQDALVELRKPMLGRWGSTDASRRTLFREDR
jgi:hypothetical protein